MQIIVEQVIEEIKRIWKNDENISQTEDFKNKIGFYNFRIRMINTDFKTYCDNEHKEKFLIRRKVLHKLLISDMYNNKCSFEPCKYHGVKLEFYWNKCKEKQDGICNCKNHCFGKGSG